jgi:hypothetical protein
MYPSKKISYSYSATSSTSPQAVQQAITMLLYIITDQMLLQITYHQALRQVAGCAFTAVCHWHQQQQ